MFSMEEKGTRDGKMAEIVVIAHSTSCVSLHFPVPCKKVGPCTSYDNGLPGQRVVG